MDFGGDLKTLAPSSIFQICRLSSLNGLLKLIAVHKVASLYFVKGELIYATFDTYKKKKLGEILVEKKLITENQLISALWAFQHKKEYQRIGQILVERGYLERDALVSVMQEQMRQVIYDVLTWEEGHFFFFKDVSPEDGDILLDVNMDCLMLEAFRRADEKKVCEAVT